MTPFNSSKVQLERSEVLDPDDPHRPFNSSKVQLEQRDYCLTMTVQYHFQFQ